MCLHVLKCFLFVFLYGCMSYHASADYLGLLGGAVFIFPVSIVQSLPNESKRIQGATSLPLFVHNLSVLGTGISRNGYKCCTKCSFLASSSWNIKIPL